MKKKSVFILIIIISLYLAVYAEPADTSLISCDFKQTEITDVLRAIGIQSGINVIAMPEVKGEITLHLENVSIESALDSIVRSKGYVWKMNNSIYEVSKAVEEKKEPEKQQSADTKEIFTISVKDNKIFARAVDCDIIKFLMELSNKTGFSFVPDESVKGKITISLNETEFELAIENIINGSGFSFIENNGIYKIYKDSEKKQIPPKLNIELSNDSLTIDLVSADIGDVIQEIAKKAGLDIIFYGSIKGKIEKMKISGAKIDDALNKIIEGSKFGVSKIGDVYNISALNDENSAVMINSLRYIKIKNLKAEEIIKMLPSYIKADKIKVFPEHNAILFEGTQSMIKRLEEYISSVDKPAPVIMLEAQIIDFTDDLSKNQNLSLILKGGGNNISISPGNISADIKSLPLRNITDEFSTTLQNLITEGKAEVKASPKIATVSGKEATINVALEEHFKVTTGNVETPLTSIQKISSGIQLKIKPVISDNSEYIRVEIFVKVSSPGSMSSDGIPAVNTRDAKTELSIKDGQTIIIAGLIQDRSSQSEDNFPLLGKIPIIKSLFTKKVKSQSKSELVFYITPRIIK